MGLYIHDICYAYLSLSLSSGTLIRKRTLAQHAQQVREEEEKRVFEARLRAAQQEQMQQDRNKQAQHSSSSSSFSSHAAVHVHNFVNQLDDQPGSSGWIKVCACGAREQQEST